MFVSKDIMENHLGKEFIYESRTPGMKNTQSQT
jgi:hypothetical protein